MIREATALFTVTVTTPRGVVAKTYETPVPAADVLEEVGVFLRKPCGGKGTCGKCRVMLNGEEVLACRTVIESDASLALPADAAPIQGVTEGILRNFVRQPLVEEGYGVAVDIGTTTVAGYLYHFPDCRREKAVCVPNPQGAYGADVISRIEHVAAGHGEALRRCIHETVAELTAGYEVKVTVICGNTAMLHLFTGRDPAPLAVAPYITNYRFGEWLGTTYLAPCASAYIGADVMTAVLSTGITEQETAFLVDIGTNGEMALHVGGKLLCCSTAAGPCFEGAGIDCGTPAVPGAINRVSVEDGVLTFTTIDGQPPIGLCGTGLVDGIAALLELEIIDETGYMEENYYFGDSGVYLSPEDVRKFQLAKSAIRSGIETLLHYAAIAPEQVERFCIAGGFGSFLRIESAVKTGLIPASLAGKAVSVGNAAGMGAAMILQSRQALETVQRLADEAETVSLAESAFFQDAYVENMMFEE